jgi:hypothetical protein
LHNFKILQAKGFCSNVGTKQSQNAKQNSVRKQNSSFSERRFEGRTEDVAKICFLIPEVRQGKHKPRQGAEMHENDQHFRFAALGDWTTSLNKKCEKLYEARPKQDSLSTQELPYENSQRKLIMPPFVVQVDGPCGAPAQRYSDFKVLLLVVPPPPPPYHPPIY